MASEKLAGGRKGVRWFIVVLVAAVLLVIAIIMIVHERHAAAPSVTKSGCVSRELAMGSAGACVIDAQAMINYIETSGLNECPFTGSKTLPATGTYDSETAQQVKVAQTWINCYNKQEGSKQTISVSGNIDASTWQLLCSYGYQFPSHSQSSTSHYRNAAIAAGKAAGCAQT